MLRVVAERQFAETISERQLIGIFNFDDGFKAASSWDRLSSLDPLPTSGRSESTLQSRHFSAGWRADSGSLIGAARRSEANQWRHAEGCPLALRAAVFFMACPLQTVSAILR